MYLCRKDISMNFLQGKDKIEQGEVQHDNGEKSMELGRPVVRGWCDRRQSVGMNFL